MRAPRGTYSTSGPLQVIRVSNATFGLAFAAFLVNLALFAWWIYLIIKIAAHVGAWPF